MKESIEQQLFFIRWAIQLGERGRYTAPPNPWVGCVIVKNGAILSEGYHVSPGQQHAEMIALEKAGALAKGATAYISLEPCAHYGRTPPCTESIIAAGIKKVVIPFLDPDPFVSGKGVNALMDAGIEVVVGVGKEEAERSLAPYLFQRRHKRPFCILKSAVSLDGRIAASDGSSQWITGEKARLDVQLLRAQSQAVLIGAHTALQDSPRLTVRDVEVIKQPLRVVLDAQGKLPPKGPLANIQMAPTLIFTCATHYIKEWKECGAEIFLQEKANLQEVLNELGKRQIIQLLIEGGGQVHANFLKENLINRIVIYVGNCLLGANGKPLLPDFFVSNIKETPRFILAEVHRFDNDVRLDYDIVDSV